jgi:hypothetical protein
MPLAIGWDLLINSRKKLAIIHFDRLGIKIALFFFPQDGRSKPARHVA